MRVTVVDENHAITHAAYRVLLPAGVKTSFASSLDELSLVFENTGPPDLLVVNVWGGVTSWGVAGRLRRAGYRGRVLAFVDSAVLALVVLFLAWAGWKLRKNPGASGPEATGDRHRRTGGFSGQNG